MGEAQRLAFEEGGGAREGHDLCKHSAQPGLRRDLSMGRQDLRRQGCKRFYPEKLLEGETLRLLSSLQIDEAVSEWLLAELEKLHDQGMDEVALRIPPRRRISLERWCRTTRSPTEVFQSF
jgi:hypothetical protein